MSEADISRIPFRVEIQGFGEARGELIRFLAPQTVDALLRILPLRGRVSISNAQVYFEVPMKIGNEKAVTKVERGDVGYWPFGAALCFFKEQMRPYRPVNLVGKVLSGLEVFQNVPSGTPIKVERS